MTSTPKKPKAGLITMPAIKYPSTDPRPNRDAIGTDTTPAIRKMNAKRRKSVIGQPRLFHERLNQTGGRHHCQILRSPLRNCTDFGQSVSNRSRYSP